MPRKMAQFDACCLVGPEHNWANYFASPAIVDRLVAVRLCHPAGEPAERPQRRAQPAQFGTSAKM